MKTFSSKELQDCAERELRLRRRVYPRWVEAGKISNAKAAEELALMEAIAGHFRALAEQDSPGLFPGAGAGR